tara:strand:- start:7047 stop:7454 length:408 start_codon:yes stop_codon:yes gene_type:complete
MDLLKEYHEWHKKLVTTNGENIPEWFWLLTDQGILGHIIRENDYHVNTLTQKISLSHHNNTNGINRYKGKAEKWYFPTQPSFQELPFEHVWLDKINTESLRNKKYFKELVDELNMSHYLTDVRWSTYWDDYHEKQ